MKFLISINLGLRWIYNDAKAPGLAPRGALRPPRRKALWEGGRGRKKKKGKGEERKKRGKNGKMKEITTEKYGEKM